MRNYFVALLLGLSFVPAGAATLLEAQSLYDRNSIAQAKAAFGAVAADAAASNEDRSEAERQLARIAWLIDGKLGEALAHLERARALGSKPCSTAARLARYLREGGQPEAALSRQAALVAGCEGDPEADDLRTQLIRARLDLSVRGGSDRPRLLGEAVTEGRAIADRTHVAGARARFQAALLAADPVEALQAWSDFFWLEDGEDAPPALKPLGATARFREGLAANASAAARLRLADLLMRAGFLEESERHMAGFQPAPGNAEEAAQWRKLQAYWRELRKVEAEVLRVNRAYAHGARKESLELDSAAQLAAAALMKAAGETGDPPAALLRAYGIVATAGRTSGYASIHMGHVIEDHDDRVTQYGKSADIRFRAIDNMLANGFESWLWDGSAMVGGWAGDGVIVHVRPGYVTSPMSAFRLTFDSPRRREFIGRQAKRAAADIAALRLRSVATLNGLSDRLQLQLVDQIWAAARSRGKTEADVKRLFLAEYSRANLDQSIRVHEGRHAIDNALGQADQSVLEYQAKLSELALTAYPRMALENMNRNLEGEGPHDRAGARVFDEYRKWIEAHPGEVMGFDPAIPALAQLDKLTDGQIREIAHGLDPLAKGEAARTSGGSRF